MSMQGITATEMAKELNLPLATVKQRLRRAGCKPFCQEALYTHSDFEKISVAPMGRPFKKTETKPNKSNSTKKPTKGKKWKRRPGLCLVGCAPTAHPGGMGGSRPPITAPLAGKAAGAFRVALRYIITLPLLTLLLPDRRPALPRRYCPVGQNLQFAL